MSVLPHICNRRDCEHNITAAGQCTFFTGDMYFLQCLRDGNMYTPRNGQKQNCTDNKVKQEQKD